MHEIGKKICKEVLELYGPEAQKNVLIEECSELIQAICKDKRGLNHNVEEEIADVYIMLEQMKLVYDLGLIDLSITSKLERIKRRSKVWQRKQE